MVLSCILIKILFIGFLQKMKTLKWYLFSIEFVKLFDIKILFIVFLYFIDKFVLKDLRINYFRLIINYSKLFPG